MRFGLDDTPRWDKGDAIRIDTPDGVGAGWYVVAEVEQQYDEEGYAVRGATSMSLIPDPTNSGEAQSSLP